MKFDFKKQFKNAWDSLLRLDSQTSDSSGIDRKKVSIFIVCLFLAFCLWLVVSLNRSYTINLEIPVATGKINTKKALAEELPPDITATVSGLGWHLIGLYNDPPQILINVTGQQVNLLQQVRNQIDQQDLRVQKVTPFSLRPNLVPRQKRKVPVRPRVDIQFDNQYGFMQEPSIIPDSIVVSGSAEQIRGIKYWPTDSISREDVKSDLSLKLSLKKPDPLVQLSSSSVNYQATVVKLTNDEVTVPIKKRNFPSNRMVTFIPSSVTIEYEVPLQEYDEINHSRPFKAYITYQQLKQDSTGFLKPKIKQLAKNVHLKIRSVTPSEVNYFTIIESGHTVNF